MSKTQPDRRTLAVTAATAAAAAFLAPSAQAQGARAAPSLTFRFALDIKVGPAQELGDYGGGRRRVIPILSGVINGPGLTAEVLPGGADWQTLRPDGLIILQARYTVKASDGAIIGIINSGVRKATPEIARRMAAGEAVDASQYYFRTTPVFEVGPGPHQWLVENIFVGVAERLPDLVRISIFQVG